MSDIRMPGPIGDWSEPGTLRPSELAAQPIEDFLETLPVHPDNPLFTAGLTDQITRPGHEWADTLTELEWIGTDGDFREEIERLPTDRTDAERLMATIESQLPADYLTADAVTIELTSDELDRLHVLVGLI